MKNKKEYITGALFKNENDRLALDDWHELHCGSCVQLKLCGKWVSTRIEADFKTGEYYAVGLIGLKLEGVLARICV